MLLCAPFGVDARADERWDALAETVFLNYGRDQGLPHPVPTALAQGRDGFLWIGTQGGLARWDGYRFRAYRANARLAGSLNDDWVQTLHVDPAGRLWIGGGAGGLARYDATQDLFVPVPLRSEPAGRTHIAALLDDEKGGLWVATDEGLYHLDPSTGQRVLIQAGTGDGAGLPAGPVRSLARDSTGALWVGTTMGLARGTPDGTAFTAVPMADGTVSVTALLADGDGRLWIGTMRKGLYVIDTPGAVPRPVDGGPALSAASISSLCLAGPHEVWAGLRGRGIVAVDSRMMQVREIRHDRTLPSSLAHDDVWALLRDNAGSVWVGSTGGLSHHPADPGLISTIFGPSQRPGGLTGSDVIAILPTHDGRIWLGYLGGGIDVIDPMRGTVLSMHPDPNRGDKALPPEIIFGIAEDDHGRVYVGTRRGLYGADPTTGEVHLITLPGRDPRAAVGAITWTDGVLWIGGEEDGLTGVATGPPGPPLAGPLLRPALSDPGVQTIRRGPGRDLWVGTRNGLNRIDLADMTVEQIHADPSDPDALPGRFVTAILFDARDRMWVGTFGNGLGRMTGRTPDGRLRFQRIGLEAGLPHLNVDSLQMDGGGTIWAGTDDGLAMIDPEAGTVRPLRRADGAPLVDYFAGGGATSLEGEGLLGAKGGFTVTKPGTLPPWRLRPPIVVTDLRVGGVSVPVGQVNSPESRAPLILTPRTNSLAVEFAALDFTAPERNRYAYRMDGVDSDWIETDVSRRLAIYANLPPGNYTLRLRGSNRDGVWTDRNLVLPIRVLPAWYQHGWVMALATLMLILAVLGLVRWRTRFLQSRQRALERQIADRTADLRAANERLERLAMTDTLTGCANRRHFMERAAEMVALAGRHATPLSLAILDLDDFKQTNDTFGHPAGDAVLAQTGQLLHRHLRTTDLVGRVGGEEFALLMPHTDLDGAGLLAERLRGAIADADINLDGTLIRVTASQGLAQLRAGEDFDELYSRADTALYRAKLNGRNRVETDSNQGGPPTQA